MEAIIDLTTYTGLGADHGDSKATAVALENTTYSHAVYRSGSVDHVFFNEAVALQPATVDYLYSAFTPLQQPFTPGAAGLSLLNKSASGSNLPDVHRRVPRCCLRASCGRK